MSTREQIAGALFNRVERRLVDWFDANGIETGIQDGEWFAYLEEGGLSITAMAKAVADDLTPVR